MEGNALRLAVLPLHRETTKVLANTGKRFLAMVGVMNLRLAQTLAIYAEVNRMMLRQRVAQHSRVMHGVVLHAENSEYLVQQQYRTAMLWKAPMGLCHHEDE
eukprot:8747832-Pyramimonas_sp.AAC.1